MRRGSCLVATSTQVMRASGATISLRCSRPGNPLAVDADVVGSVRSYGILARPAADDVEAAATGVDPVVALSPEEAIAAGSTCDPVCAPESANENGVRRCAQTVAAAAACDRLCEPPGSSAEHKVTRTSRSQRPECCEQPPNAVRAADERRVSRV
jgi:hypothetical protein